MQISLNQVKVKKLLRISLEYDLLFNHLFVVVFHIFIGQMGKATKSILVIVMIASLASMGLTSNQAYGGNLNTNSVVFEDNFVHASWTIPPGAVSATPPDSFETFSSSGLPLSEQPAQMTCDESLLCVFQIPNFVDELDTKIIFIDITFDTGTGTELSTPTVSCIDSTGTSAGIFLFQGFDLPDLFIFDFKCIPNPDREEITIQFDPNVLFVEIWTTSFDDIPVGGTLVPIETTALLLASTQMTASWLIPIIVAGAGFILVLGSRKSE